MGAIPWLLIVAICFILIKSLLEFIRGTKAGWRMEMRDSRFSAELFYTLLIIYSTVIIGFGLIYFIISFHGIILVEGERLREVSILGSIIHSVYFSGTTMLTIGYGDITPIGIGRFIALIEALIGYILPTAFILRLVQSQQRSREK
ncbi:two pore domain potassium channel family protein [Virgibacillus sp. NKC19-3]|uniref:potassium channel family protein n=1 Tax=Virgibacillus saliphilus TaxID=2831674 RepID=UPI001C9B7578|nr:potassium channel family protein [Virgibacillus sp. NKC19-3]MBY7142751.1 two pore domain potassium channel family protein [Virgibacillus sp. NKC19-3]